MLRIGIVLAFFCALFFGSEARADETACERPLTITAFQPDAVKLRRRASFINLWWTSAEAQTMSFEQKKAQRLADIAELYGEIEDSRKEAYASATCLVVATKKCASTSGKRHECPMSYSPHTNMRLIPATLKAINTNFDVPPQMSGTSIIFTNKKTGAGSNTDGFQAMAEYKPDYVATRVKAEMDQVRAIVEPLLDSVLDAASNG